MTLALCKCGAWVDDADIQTHRCCGVVVGNRTMLIADLNRIKVWQQLNPTAALLVRYAAKELADLEAENAALRELASGLLIGLTHVRIASNIAEAKRLAGDGMDWADKNGLRALLINHARSERVIKGGK